MSTSLWRGTRGLQILPLLNVLHKYIRTMIGLLFGIPSVLPHKVTRPSLVGCDCANLQISWSSASDRLATHLLYFAFHGYFASIFAKHTTKYETPTIHFSFFIQISCLWKNKTMKSFWHFTRTLLMVRNTKRKKNDAKCKKSAVKYLSIHFSFFTFCEHFMLREKCIAGYRVSVVEYREWKMISDSGAARLCTRTVCYKDQYANTMRAHRKTEQFAVHNAM